MAVCAGLDLIEELRLRRWARENYTSLEERDPAWHPVVLDEMRRRDLEGSLGGETFDDETDYSYRLRLDAMFGPRVTSPHFARTSGREAVDACEMHYF
ncbi:MAG: hypothetical protein KF774_13395 [Planctomyces sp.]|nr:hypothetical protein [Planctomyces sp.]